jgi:hypothetical protein
MTLRTTEPPPRVLELVKAALQAHIGSASRVAAMRQADLTQLAASAPHQVFTLDFNDLLGTDLFSKARLVGWRYLVTGANRTAMAAEVACDDKGENLRFSHLHEGPLVGGLAQALVAAEHTSEVVQGSYELRVLRIPSIYVMALWLKANTPDKDLFVPAAPTSRLLIPGQMYSASAFADLLKKAAQAHAQHPFDSSPKPASQ